MNKKLDKNKEIKFGRKADSQVINDGWTNIYTRQGVQGIDKATGFSHARGTVMREQELKSIYRSDGFGKKLVNRPTDDMVRAWFDVKGDSDGLINKELQNICASREIRTALRWAKVFGGSLVVMGIDDGGKLEEEVNEKNIQSVEFLKVYDRFRVTWETGDLDNDASSKNFGLPEVYTITPIASDVQSFKVHYTRVLRFDGELTDEETKQENKNWDDSVYIGIREQLINLNSSYGAVKSILDEYVMTIIKIENLQEMIAAGNDDLVKKRMDILDLGRHTINAMILDTKEDYNKSSSSTGGLDKLLQEFQVALAAVTDIPMVIFMGVSPGGMNSTGDADIRLYYDSIASSQDDKMRAQMLTLVKYVMLSKDGPFGSEIKDWSIEFNPLWQPTAKEAADTRKIQSETDIAYITTGVLTPVEVRESRFGGEAYSTETTIDATATKQLQQLPVTVNNPDNPDKDKENNNDAFTSFGSSSESKDHTHEIFFDTDTGNGWAGPGGEEDHTHRIERFMIQPRQDLDGTTHLHLISKEILTRLMNNAS